MVEESESESESVVAGDQEGDDVEEDASDAVVDGDGESGEADNLEFFCVNILVFTSLYLCSQLPFCWNSDHTSEI